MNTNKLSHAEKKQIVEAVHLAEKNTTGEIRVHVSYAKNEADLLESAKNCFVALKMHQTEERNGILLYINPMLRKFALFGDEGIHQKVGQNFWDDLRNEIRVAIQEKSMVAGIVLAVHEMGSALKEFFPDRTGQTNELSNDITES